MGSEASSLLLAGRLDELLPLVYDELRQLAAAILRQERPGHSLQPTALVNEAYLRLIDATKVEWQGRAQFLALAARSMRQILVDHARARDAAKRGGDRARVTLVDDSLGARGPEEADLLDVDEAIEALAALEPRKARVVELRFFAGLEMQEIAEVLRIGMTTAEDDWYFARAWLRRRLGGAEGGAPRSGGTPGDPGDEVPLAGATVAHGRLRGHVRRGSRRNVVVIVRDPIPALLAAPDPGATPDEGREPAIEPAPGGKPKNIP